MHVGSRPHPGVDDGIGSFNDELGAGEAEEVRPLGTLGGHILRKQEGNEFDSL